MSFQKKMEKCESPEYFSLFKEIFPTMDEKFMFNFASSMQILHKVTTITEAYFNSVGLSKGRFMIMVNLMVSDPVNGESISNLLPFYTISSATMTGLLDTLEKSDMIERIPNPNDRRRVNIRLTENGRSFMMKFLPEHQANARDMSRHLSESEREQMPVILNKLFLGIYEFLEENKVDPEERKDMIL